MTPFDPRLPIIATEAKVKTCHVFHCWQALREMGRDFHNQAFASFAGLEIHHVDAILAALSAHSALPQGRTTPSARGTRLALDFVIPEDWIAFAIKERRWEPVAIHDEARIFADYWHSRGGSGGVKLDWKKTWQNWVRNSKRANGNYAPAHTIDPRVRLERELETAVLLGRDYEADQIRRQLTKMDNVIPFNRIDSEIESKAAYLGR